MQLTPFPNEEVPAFQAELQALLDKHSAQLEAEPQFMKNTVTNPQTGEVLSIWNQVMKFVVYKKTEAVVSPIQDEDIKPTV